MDNDNVVTLPPIDTTEEAKELLAPDLRPVKIAGLEGEFWPYELGISTELEIYGYLRRLDAIVPSANGLTAEQLEERAFVANELLNLTYNELSTRYVGEKFMAVEEFGRKVGKNTAIRLVGMLLSFGRDPNELSATL